MRADPAEALSSIHTPGRLVTQHAGRTGRLPEYSGQGIRVLFNIEFQHGFN